MNAADIVAHLDRPTIEAAATAAAAQLRSSPAACVGFGPGDATYYRFVVVHPERALGSPGEYLVCLATGFGRSYPWNPKWPIYPDYAATKWADGHEWTGVVVAEFLNALSERLYPKENPDA